MSLFRVIASAFGALIFLIFIAITSLVIFVSPNHFKPSLIDQINKSTGRELTIDGNLSWRLLPTLGVKIGHAELSNPSGFDQKVFAEINDAVIKVNLLPLLFSKVELNGISLDGLKINLIENADGKNNWEDLSHSLFASTSNIPKENFIELILKGLKIYDGSVSWINEKTNQSVNIERISVYTKNNIFLKPFQFVITCNFSGKNPSLTGLTSFTSQVSIDPVAQIFLFKNFTLNGKLWNNFQLYTYIQGDAAANFNRETLLIQIQHASLSGLQLAGNANIEGLFTQPIMSGHIQLQPLDVKSWLETTWGHQISTLQSFADLSSEFDFKTGTTLQSIDMHGMTKVDDVRFHNVNIQNINIKFELKNGILKLAPMMANFYKGNIDGNVSVDFNPAIPQISLQEKLLHVDVHPLISDLSHTQKLDVRGIGNIDLELTTSGTDVSSDIANLNGSAHLTFDNGVLEGIDINHALDAANALTNNTTEDSLDTGETPFNSLTASAVIHNGIVLNNDLLLNAAQFETNGLGTINLNTQEIHYQLLTIEKGNNIQATRGIPIPLLATGSLESPHIQLDTDTFKKAIAAQVKNVDSQ